MEDFRPTKYKLRCVATGRVFEDDGLVLEDRQCNTPSLIRTEYEVKCIDIRSDDSGIYKFCDWLPVRRTLKGSAAPVTYKSEGLAAHLGLDNLYITFSGYFPEKGAEMTTCSFKETEAYAAVSTSRPDAYLSWPRRAIPRVRSRRCVRKTIYRCC